MNVQSHLIVRHAAGQEIVEKGGNGTEGTQRGQ